MVTANRIRISITIIIACNKLSKLLLIFFYKPAAQIAAPTNPTCGFRTMCTGMFSNIPCILPLWVKLNKKNFDFDYSIPFAQKTVSIITIGFTLPFT